MLGIVRKALGRVIVTVDGLTRPKPITRDGAAQAAMDQRCRDLAVYELEGCPFCVKVRREMHRLALPIERRDVGKNPAFQNELMAGGKVDQVPCLRINEGGSVRWLYESSEIIAFLQQYK
jgi:glutaredoxin